MAKKYKTIIISILIFVLAIIIRLVGLDWDQGQHLHPDERFLTMVVSDIKLPSSISQYFNTNDSPLNPQNYSAYQFFVYGTFPIFITKVIAVALHLDNYSQINLVGRALSALFDSFNIFLLILISKKLFSSSSKIIYLPSIIYALTVLPVQQSHFFTVDTFLSTFLLATFTLLYYQKYFLSATTFGLALACKITALYFIPIILLFIILYKPKHWFSKLFISIIITFIVFRTFQPYAFTNLYLLSPKFVENLKILKQYSQPTVGYPPSVQWIGTLPVIFPLKNIIIWGLGLPISLLLIISYKRYLHQSKIFYLCFAWVVFLLLFQGSQSTPTMRYFLPIYPFIILVTVVVSRHLSSKILLTSFLLHFIYLLAFLNIYFQPHSRVQASNWIYQHVPAGSTITGEYWDDFLPLNNNGEYNSVELHLYDPDTTQKWIHINSQLSSANYIVMSSNRLWGSIPRVPQFYPQTSVYYQKLFDNQSPFKLINKTVSYPGFQLPIKNCYYFGPTNYPSKSNNWLEISQCNYPGLYLRDDTAEEAFTVYDHPQVLVFASNK